MGPDSLYSRTWIGRIQVPAGTLHDGEPPEGGVLREAEEETGLHSLILESFLGMEEDPSEGPRGPITFELFWVPLPDGVPPLSAGHEATIPVLLVRLGLWP